MNLLLLLIGLACNSSHSFFTETDVNLELETATTSTLLDAITAANNNLGVDSIFLSTLNTEYVADQYLISDHLIFVNDLTTNARLMTKDIQFSVEHAGNLELVGFDLKNLEAEIINRGAVSLTNCVFEEGRDLTRLIKNQGAFTISNGVFKGSHEGEIIRDAAFSLGAYVIL